MAAQPVPTVRRRQLAAELKRLRLAGKLTIEQVADTLEWSSGKVSRIENARNSVNQRDTRRLLDLYQVADGPEREALLTLARQSRERGRWQQYGDAIPEWFATYVGLEAGASSIARYQAEYVPGLLQTRDYATAVHRAAAINADPAEIERQVSVRMERQARLTEADAPQLWVVLNEAVIRRIVGTRQTMHEQLAKLIEVAEMPNVTLQVLPFAAGAHPAMDSAFSLLEFDDTGGSVVYIEYPTGALYLERQDEVQRYRLAFDHLRAVSLSLAESSRIMSRAVDDLALRKGYSDGCGPELAQVDTIEWQRRRLHGVCERPRFSVGPRHEARSRQSGFALQPKGMGHVHRQSQGELSCWRACFASGDNPNGHGHAGTEGAPRGRAQGHRACADGRNCNGNCDGLASR